MPKSKREGLRFGEGSIRTHGNGFSARWRETGPDGRVIRRSRTFRTEDEAEDHLRSMFRAKRDGRYIPPSEMTVTDVIDGWLLRGQARWKAWTYRTYVDRASIHVLPTLGNLRADALTTHRVQHWIDQLVRSGLAPATVDAAITVLRAAMKEAVALEIVRRNPVTGTKGPIVTIKESPTWSVDDIGRVMAALRDEPEWFALYRLALSAGMRPGELRALRWDDLDAPAKLLHIRRTATRDDENRVKLGRTTKTGRSRQIPVSDGVIDALDIWRTAQKSQRMASPNWHNEGLIFTSDDGLSLRTSTWARFHQRLCERAGIGYVTLHQAVRHTPATHALEAGLNPKLVADRLGHSSITITLDRYSHPGIESQRSASETLDQHLFGDAERA